MKSCPLCSHSDSRPLYRTRDRSASLGPCDWLIRRCPLCRVGWTDPPPSSEQIRLAYPDGYLGDTAKTVDEFLSGRLQRSRSWKNELEKVRMVERLAPTGAILDVGCGDGKFLWALDPKRWQRSGVEYLEEVVGIVKDRMPHLDLIPGDVWASDLDPRRFDVITLWHVFEHLPEPQRVLERLRGLLSPQGLLLLAVPNLDSLQARWFGAGWLGLDAPRHLFHYSPQVLRGMLQESGFQIQKQMFGSSRANLHHLKHSLIHWSEDRFGSRLPYYLFKWTLFLVNWAEQLSGRYGMLVVVGRKEA
ncbi:MAG: class I SAM-dependent methyltransferase [Acidobacteriota bacterium]